MDLNNALLGRQAFALFNFLITKHENDKRIGELSVKDVMEIVKFLTEGGLDAED